MPEHSIETMQWAVMRLSLASRCSGLSARLYRELAERLDHSLDEDDLAGRLWPWPTENGASPPPVEEANLYALAAGLSALLRLAADRRLVRCVPDLVVEATS